VNDFGSRDAQLLSAGQSAWEIADWFRFQGLMIHSAAPWGNVLGD
jgi:hypothetical protein